MTQLEELERAFTCIPLLAGLGTADFNIGVMRGHTNHNFRLQDARRDWVVRIPKNATNAFIDRAAEAYNQRLASELGIAPLFLWRDSDGMSITPTIAASHEVTRVEFESETVVRKIVAALRLLHGSDRRFQGILDLRELISRYYSMLPQAQQTLFQPRLERAQAILDSLQEQGRGVVPSHNDLVLGNLLVAENNLWLIDWEYSAMASPYWDLATICNSARLSETKSRQLLQIYCEAAEPMEESTLFHYRELLQLLSDCWMSAFAAD